jgi:hypothetical protein
MINQLNYFRFALLTAASKATVKFPYKDIIKKVSDNFLQFIYLFAGGVNLEINETFLMEYISSHLDNKVYLPLELIRDAVANNWLDSLCYYLWMKKLHRKPVIYNYSLRKIGATINCSPTTIKTHISILKQHGLCEISAGINSTDLHLKSTNSFFAEKQLMVPIQISYNKAEQRNLLRFATIKRNLHSQSRQFNIKNNALNYRKGLVKTYNEVKTGLRLAKLFPDSTTLENSMQNVLTLSNEKFGSLCNRSQSTGIKIQKAFNELNLIISTARVRLIDPKSHNRREFFRLELRSSHFLSKKGQVYKRLTNAIGWGKAISSIAIIGQA